MNGNELTPEQLSDQLKAEQDLYYARLHDSENLIEQKVDEFGDRHFKNDDGEWELFED